jgi:hypothetical protein
VVVAGAAAAAALLRHEEESEEEALRAYPSAHTCLVCNVIALESLLREAADSRFLIRGSIPPCYLSCACNFERDSATGEVFTYEVAISDHQERCREEAALEPEVSFCLDPRWQSDWLGYFRDKLSLSRVHEIYSGEEFLRNQLSARPLRKGEEAYPVHTLRRTSLGSFESDARASKPGSLGSVGCVVAFRHEASQNEPFGMWFGWLICGGHFFILDLQNSGMASSLRGSIQELDWSAPAREEAFFATFK